MKVPPTTANMTIILCTIRIFFRIPTLISKFNINFEISIFRNNKFCSLNVVNYIR